MKDSFRPAIYSIPYNLTGMGRKIYQTQELDQKNLKILENVKTIQGCKIVTFFEEERKIVIIGEEKSFSETMQIIKEMFNLPTENSKSQGKVVLSTYMAAKLKGKNNNKINFIQGRYKVTINEQIEGANTIFLISGPKQGVEEAKESMMIKEETLKLSQEVKNMMYDMDEYAYKKFFFEKNIVLFNLDDKTNALYVIGCDKAIASVKEAIEKLNFSQKHYKRRY